VQPAAGLEEAAAVQASLASRTMIDDGRLFLVFVVYHILHFTIHVADPISYASHYSSHGHEVPDVIPGGEGFLQLTDQCLRDGPSFPLSHGFASVFQTLGFRSSRTAVLLKYVGVCRSFSRTSHSLSVRGPIKPVAPESARLPDISSFPYAKIPGSIQDKWTQHKFKSALINPKNKRRYTVPVVVEPGLAGASAAASLSELQSAPSPPG